MEERIKTPCASSEVTYLSCKEGTTVFYAFSAMLNLFPLMGKGYGPRDYSKRAFPLRTNGDYNYIYDSPIE